jgi:hypothetical protein
MINKRVFGADIPLKVKKKLEARQIVAGGGISDPNAEINPSKYTIDDNETLYKYNELINSNFNMEADLSSRTPFIRMWTAIAIVNQRQFEIKKTEDDLNANEDNSAESQHDNTNSMNKVTEILNRVKYKEMPNGRQVYMVGTNNIQDVYDNVSADYAEAFPTENNVTDDNNAFLKPIAGITSAQSETEGVMGSIKKTTVNFVVHNFADYDTIYNKYFLRPGAQIVIDFGWDTLGVDDGGVPIKLYNPKDLLDDANSSEDSQFEKKLYGEADRDNNVSEDGFVTRCNGDVETLIGIVTNYSSKVLQNGSVECSVTITSKNSALSLYPKFTGNEATEEAIISKFNFEIEQLIFYEQMYNMGNNADRQNLEFSIKDNVNKIADGNFNPSDEIDFDQWIEKLRYDSFGSDSFQPSALSAPAGLFIVGDGPDTEDTYMSWGFFEDRFLNTYFGHGNGATSINSEDEAGTAVKINSKLSYTTWEYGFWEKQRLQNEATPYLIPNFWDVTYSFNGPNHKDKAGDGLKQLAIDLQFTEEDLQKELDGIKGDFESIDPKNIPVPSDFKTIITKYDKQQKRVPIREIFIHTKIIKDAFENDENETFKQVVQEILDAVNDDSYGLWEWKITGTENELHISDINYSSLNQGDDNSRKSTFDNMFVFEVMGKNSIATNYGISLDMPSDEIGTMYAIQAMTGSPGKFYPVSDLIEKHSVLQTICNNPNNVVGGEDAEKYIGFKYLPDLSAYNMLTQISENENFKTKLAYFQSTKKAFDSQSEGISKNANYGVDIIVGRQGTLYVNEDGDEDDYLKKNPTSENTETGNYNTEERISKNNERFDGFIVDTKNYFNHMVTGEYIKEKHYRAIPLPMKLELTIYGIATLKPGDVFRVDYLPQVYLDSCYFQIMKVSHSVDSSGWYTTFDTQFRVAPHKYQNENSTNAPDISADEKLAELEDAIINQLGLTDSDEESAALIEKTLNSVIVKDDGVDTTRSGLDPRDLVGGKEGLLEVDINDRNAYVWTSDAAGFSVLYLKSGLKSQYKSFFGAFKQGGTLQNNQFHKRPWGGEFSPYFRYITAHLDQTWDFLGPESGAFEDKGGVFMSGETGAGGKFYKKAIINKNFETLKGFMTNLQIMDTSEYEWFSRLFSFEIACEVPVIINNPLYYWDEKRNRYNGYGNYYNMLSQNGKYFTYVGGLYMPGEKCYLIINNTFGGAYHWAVVPQTHSQMSRNAYRNGSAVNLKHYDHTTHNPNWGDDEWEEQGWGAPPNGKYPAAY